MREPPVARPGAPAHPAGGAPHPPGGPTARRSAWAGARPPRTLAYGAQADERPLLERAFAGRHGLHRPDVTRTAVGQIIDATARNIDDFAAGRHSENALVPKD
ncbi:hypothetical protein ACIGXI_38270 [Kitasatospora aureofaciens]|uniref:hypothetical protein n=1 Tax=Kitasatospora aureofaciens TaxID=1894 RepID=UPI0037C73B9C